MKRYDPVERNVLRALDPSQRGHFDKALRLARGHAEVTVRLPGRLDQRVRLSTSRLPTEIDLGDGRGVKGHVLTLARPLTADQAAAAVGRPVRSIVDHPLLDRTVVAAVRADGAQVVLAAFGSQRSWSLAEIDGEVAALPVAA